MRTFKTILLVLVLTTIGCAGTKTSSEKNSVTKESDKTEINNDKKSETNVNKAIDDRFNINVKTDNEAVNEAIKKAFRDFGYNKQSGSNSTQMTFDPDLMAFKIANYIGQTQDKSESSVSDTKIEKSFEEKTDEYFSKKISQMPWWLWLIAAIYFLPKLIECVSVIMNPLSGLLEKFKRQ